MSHTIRRSLIYDNNQKARAFLYELIDPDNEIVLASVLGKDEIIVVEMFLGLMRQELKTNRYRDFRRREDFEDSQ